MSVIKFLKSELKTNKERIDLVNDLIDKGYTSKLDLKRMACYLIELNKPKDILSRNTTKNRYDKEITDKVILEYKRKGYSHIYVYKGNTEHKIYLEGIAHDCMDKFLNRLPEAPRGSNIDWSLCDYTNYSHMVELIFILPRKLKSSKDVNISDLLLDRDILLKKIELSSVDSIILHYLWEDESLRSIGKRIKKDYLYVYRQIKKIASRIAKEAKHELY